MMNRATDGSSQTLPYVELLYKHEESENSVRELVYSVQPKWREHPEQIKIVQFKDGITNTVRLPSGQARAFCTHNYIATEACQTWPRHDPR